MKLAIEIIKREIAQRELAQKHDHLRKDEVQLELESLNKAVKKLTIPDVSNSVKIALLKQLEELSDYIPAEIYTKKVIEIQSNFNYC